MQISATISEEVEITLTGNFVEGYPATHEEPGEGDKIEDDFIESIIITRKVTDYIGAARVRVDKQFDILAGLDAKAKLAVIQNVLDALGYDAVQSALLEIGQ